MGLEHVDSTVKRIDGYLHRVVPIADSAGKIISFSLKPIMHEFRPRDLMQVIVGASVLAVPVAFTEETWVLGAQLPLRNVLGLGLLTVVFIALFVYFNFYRYSLKGNVIEYIKRVVSIYFFSLLVVSLLLTLVQKCPWQTEAIVAVKRIMIVAFPASMSAALGDVLK